MDADTGERPPDLGPVTAQSRSDLHSRHAAITAAAEEWGLRRGHPEWRFVSSLIDAQASMADLMVSFAEDMDAVVEEHRQAARDEFARQHSAREESFHQIGVMQSVVRSLDVEKARMASEMLKEAIPKIAEGVKEAVTIRQVWVARGRAIQQALMVAAAAVGLFVGGYSMRTVQVWGMSDAALRDNEGIAVCKATTPWRDKDGMRLCRLDAFTASEAEAR